MKITNKYRVENFDRVQSEAEKLRLALHDLNAKSSKFRFAERVTVDASDFDSTYQPRDQRFTLAVSRRAMDLYLIESESGVEVLSWAEIQAERQNQTTFWRMVRYGIHQQDRLNLLARIDAVDKGKAA